MARKSSKGDPVGALIVIGFIYLLFYWPYLLWRWITQDGLHIAGFFAVVGVVIWLIACVHDHRKKKIAAILESKASKLEKACQLCPWMRGDYQTMDGISFEGWVSNLLVALGCSDVKRTKASGDFGVDVLGTMDGVRYGIQCKRYSSAVGPAAVQQVCAGLAHYGCDSGIVVTNSSFTSSARILAKENNVELWDGSDLDHFFEIAVDRVIERAEKQCAK